MTVNFNKNNITAIVGSSGCGKTALFHLIAGFYEYQEGEMYLDGIENKNIDSKDIIKNITYVQQIPFLFFYTIKNSKFLCHS